MNNNNFINESPNIVSEKLYSLFLRCSHALSRGHHQNTGIHPSQQRVLSLLTSNDKITQRDLLDIMQIRAASLSELLTKLEGKGLITRTKTDESKRSIDVEITDLGEMVAADYTRTQQESTSELFSVLSEEEQKQMVQLLSKLIEDWHNRHHNLENDGGRIHGHFGHSHQDWHHGARHDDKPGHHHDKSEHHHDKPEHHHDIHRGICRRHGEWENE